MNMQALANKVWPCGERKLKLEATSTFLDTTFFSIEGPPHESELLNYCLYLRGTQITVYMLVKDPSNANRRKSEGEMEGLSFLLPLIEVVLLVVLMSLGSTDGVV